MFLFNPNLRRVTSYSIPILFDEPQPSKKTLFAYSIFNDFIVKQLRFETEEIYIFRYNQTTNFIDSLKVYSKNNKLIGELHFNLIHKDENLISFQHTFRNGKNPVGGELKKIDNNGNYQLNFSRVGEVTFLGYKLCEFLVNENFDLIEEKYFNSKTFQMELFIKNENEYFNSQIEQKAMNILLNGW